MEMMFKRTRWTSQEVLKLQQIYAQEKLKGKKRLWIRVTNRINQNIRTAKRQAIQYKFKNLCTSEIKLCQQQRLIEMLFELIPHKGYKQITCLQAFTGITESSLKNIFYSNIRSISNFIFSYLQPKETMKQIVSMLKNRQFLLFLSQQTTNFSFIQFRRKINVLKKSLIGHKKQESLQLEEQLSNKKQQIIKQYNLIRHLYTSKDYQQQIRMTKTTIKSQNRSTQNQQISRLSPVVCLLPASMQYIQSLPTVQKKQSGGQQGRKSLELVDSSQNVHLTKLNQTNISVYWLCNDF